jgi:hypothetical protein
MFHNPGCEYPVDCNLVKVGYVKAEGPNDTLHYLWDFTRKPSILVAAAPAASNLTISWDQFEGESNKSIMFSEEPVYSFGIILDRVSLSYVSLTHSGLLAQVGVTCPSLH